MQKYKVYINNTTKVVIDNLETFCSDYLLIEAAGGLVYNSKNEVLMIFRNGKWDLPKGKMEDFEMIENCAIREIEEECGVTGIIIVKKLLDTYHTYNINEIDILKKTYWYKMKTSYSEKLSPQIEEGITKVEWVKSKNLQSRLRDTYPNIIDVFKSDL